VPADPAVRDREDEGGFTLIEMMIVMFLLTVVFSLCALSLVTIQRQVNTDYARGQAVDQVRLAIQQMDRQIRSGNLFYSPTSNGTQLVIFTQANGNQRCVEWQVSSGAIQTRSWTQTWQTDGSASVVPWSTIATGVSNSSSKPPFVLDTTHLSYGGRVLVIDLVTNQTNSESSGVEVTDSVEGRNTVYGYDASACATPYPATS
jgi:prepilin-type N-terminal cleavage/methylation domain-containing protein